VLLWVYSVEASHTVQLGKSRFQIMRAIADLERAAFIQAAFYDLAPNRNQRGIYSYIPGNGVKSSESGKGFMNASRP
jgi:hypothetical protein